MFSLQTQQLHFKFLIDICFTRRFILFWPILKLLFISGLALVNNLFR